MGFLLVLAAFWLPGAVFGAAIGLRGWTLGAAAPVLTFGVVALGIPLLGGAGVRWTALSATLWTLVVSAAGFAITWAVARFTRRRRPDADAVPPERPRWSWRAHALTALGVAAGMAIGAVTVLRGIGSPGTVNQDWDAAFHANLVRWIAERGDARPSTIGTIANLPDETHYFYPDTYHALLAVLFGKGGLSVMPLLNFASIAVTFAVPLGVAAMCRAWRLPPVTAAAAATASACFTSFPYDLFWHGPVWPYAAGVALVPAMLAVVRLLLEPGGATGPLAVGVGIGGLAALHTSVVFVLVVYCVLILAAVLFRFEPIDWRRAWPSLVAAALLAAGLGLPQVLPSLWNAGGVTSAVWSNAATVTGAVGQTVTFSPMADFPQWWIGLPAIAGIVLLARQRKVVWLVGAYVVLGGLYAATVSMENGLVHLLTGPFYNDNYRIAALLPLIGAVGFGEFVNTATAWFAAKVRPRLPKLHPAAPVLAGVVLLAAVIGGFSRAYVGINTVHVNIGYRGFPAVSADEETAFAWLAGHTVPGERVLNDRLDGSVWMYALQGIHPTQWNYYGAEPASDIGYVSAHANRLEADPRVRKILRELKVRYAFVGQGNAVPDAHNDAGLLNLDTAPGFKLVYRNAGAAIYEIAGQHDVVAAGAAPGSAADDGR
ncbi:MULTISPECIES: DUF6541 family protein [Amycolatopsis]|uniref:Uncharacterized protein n=1 Tax=Amycolatopsis bullii TaxID=941987 RepID=A0ABQ3KHY2_9PSEU|nr:DUF6541 family protein [Amycolatopsis bullii]GHG20038.1 hypothetical protein GCM10017567_43400 [Amycolatopsis bullii]